MEKEEPKQDLEKEMFELEQELNIPSNLRWHNSKPKQETLEYGLLQHIKMCLECNNESQAIRLLEKYGFEKKDGMYSEQEVLHLLDTLWDRLDRWYNETEDNEFNLKKWFDECELKKK